jgi:type IV secretory pathway TraG/TraD family ATPase VirD4
MTATVGDGKIGGSNYVKECINMNEPNSAAYVNASATITAPSDTKGSIVSVFKEKVKLFASRENLSEMLSHTEIDLSSIGKKPTAVYIIIQDEKKTYHSLATIFLKQVYETLIDVAQENGGHLPVRTNFLLDEFANMPPLKDVTTMITAARSRGMRFTLIIQNFAQLNEVYGEQNAETIKGNCGNMVYLISTELKALEEISKMCGEVKSKKDDKTSSTPLVTISDLQQMKQFEVIVRRLRMPPFKTYLTPEFKMNWGKKYPELPVDSESFCAQPGPE